MATRLLLVFNVVLIGLGIFLIHHLSRISTSIHTLTQRVDDLEVQNMQLLKQFEWLEEKKEKAKSTALTPLAVRHKSSDSVPGSNSMEVQSPATARAETDADSKEWEDKMRANMESNLDSFARHIQLDDDGKQFIADLLDQSLGQLKALTDGLQSKTLSQQEVVTESQKIQEEMDTKLSTILNRQQISVFHARFPIAPQSANAPN